MKTSTLTKIKKISIHLLVLSFLLIPLITLANDDPDPNDFIVCGYGKDDCTFGDFFILASLLIDKLIFMIAIPLATLAIMIGGVMYAMYPVNPSKKAQAWSIIKAALIGIVVALIAYTLVKFILSLVIDTSTINLNTLLP